MRTSSAMEAWRSPSRDPGLSGATNESGQRGSPRTGEGARFKPPSYSEHANEPEGERGSGGFTRPFHDSIARRVANVPSIATGQAGADIPVTTATPAAASGFQRRAKRTLQRPFMSDDARH